MSTRRIGATVLAWLVFLGVAPLTASTLQVRIAASPSEGEAPLEVELAARVSGGHPPFAFLWDFGDASNPANGRKQEHTYTEPGRYKATVRVADSLGGTASARAVIEVTQDDEPFSVLCWFEPSNGEDTYVIQFRATARGGVGNYRYSWNFGDGGTSTRRNPKHAYRRIHGVYIVTFEGTSGEESIVDQWGLVLGGYGGAPELECSSSGSGGAAPYTVKLSAVATGGTKPYTYHWNPGDGTGTIEGKSVTHTYIHPGTYVALVTVTAADGLQGMCMCGIEVTRTQSGPSAAW